MVGTRRAASAIGGKERLDRVETSPAKPWQHSALSAEKQSPFLRHPNHTGNVNCCWQLRTVPLHLEIKSLSHGTLEMCSQPSTGSVTWPLAMLGGTLKSGAYMLYVDQAIRSDYCSDVQSC